MSKPTLATIALGGCEGCHMSLIDAHEGFVDLLGVVDLLWSPFTGPDEMPEHVDVFMVEGAVQNDEDLARLLKAREAAGTLVAVGSCAVLGGIGGLRNLSPLEDVKATAFGRNAQKSALLPVLTDNVHPVSDFVKVDMSLPGCAPETRLIVQALTAAVMGEPFELSKRNLCDECHRVKSKMLEHSSEFVSDSVYALMELEVIDPDACLLEQGVMCMGPMTREGCGAVCTAANVPCRGCAGAGRADFEQGGKAVDALAAVLPAGAIMYMEDLIGTGYRFSMPVSVFPNAIPVKEANDG
jgi:F420-non-reducing hydrogenase small subunit